MSERQKVVLWASQITNGIGSSEVHMVSDVTTVTPG